MKKIAAFILLLFVLAAARAEDGRDVAVLFNSNSAASREVAEHYAKKRGVPEAQVIGLPMSEEEQISRAAYRSEILEPFVKKLEDAKIIAFKESARTNQTGGIEKIQVVSESKIRYAVLCFGVPVKIAADASINEPEFAAARPELKRNEAAVDSELAFLPLFHSKYPLSGPLGNRMYGVTNAAALHPTNGILMVARLDGPTPEVAKRLVDDAMKAEANGLWGRAYFDARGLTDGNYKFGDDMLQGAAAVASRFGFETTVDKQPGVFPTGYPLSHVAIYAGWYETHVTGAMAEPVEFVPGAFAYHLHSYSAQILRNTTLHWAGPLLHRGAAAVMGCTEEPYLDGTPDVQAFIGRWTFLGFSFGEAAYASQKALSWQTTVVGDPLYRPFAKKPQEHHEKLLREKSPLIEWSCLSIANVGLNLSPAEQVLDFLTKEVPPQYLTNSAILNEKIADIYNSKGKVLDAVPWYEKALRLEMSPGQRLRVSQTALPLFTSLGKGATAFEVLKRLIKDYPNHPDRASWEQKLAPLAEQFEKKPGP